VGFASGYYQDIYISTKIIPYFLMFVTFDGWLVCRGSSIFHSCLMTSELKSAWFEVAVLLVMCGNRWYNSLHINIVKYAILIKKNKLINSKKCEKSLVSFNYNGFRR